ncbi:hemopexin repeat-containing protein, partial [Streptomyces sp. NPDC021080]|uniref:hemopexin repeat-containing protein n=1 Tax=Streptomyces sp. NPDC021080 TaxID=3365110 RepID=UPI0037A53729
MSDRVAYFFKADRYVRYNIDDDTVDVGPVEIAKFWTALPAEFQEDLDAAVNWGDGHAYFFKADRYVRYNIDDDTVDVGPVEIAKFWTA